MCLVCAFVIYEYPVIDEYENDLSSDKNYCRGNESKTRHWGTTASDCFRAWSINTVSCKNYINNDWDQVNADGDKEEVFRTNVAIEVVIDFVPVEQFLQVWLGHLVQSLVDLVHRLLMGLSGFKKSVIINSRSKII